MQSQQWSPDTLRYSPRRAPGVLEKCRHAVTCPRPGAPGPSCTPRALCWSHHTPCARSLPESVAYGPGGCGDRSVTAPGALACLSPLCTKPNVWNGNIGISGAQGDADAGTRMLLGPLLNVQLK